MVYCDMDQQRQAIRRSPQKSQKNTSTQTSIGGENLLGESFLLCYKSVAETALE